MAGCCILGLERAACTSRDGACRRGERWLGAAFWALAEQRPVGKMVLAAVNWADWAAVADDGWALHWASAGLDLVEIGFVIYGFVGV